MSGYVVRQAVKDRGNQVVGNEVLFQPGEGILYNSSQDNRAAETISNFLLQNNEKIYDGKLVFITFTPTLLFRNIPRIFEKEKLVIQIEDDVMINPLSQKIVEKYRGEGYHFAINDFQFSPKYFNMLEYAEYIKVNISKQMRTGDWATLENIVRMSKGFHKKCIISGINGQEDYDAAVKLDADYLEGTYISGATRIKTTKVDFLQGNFFKLVVAVMREEPDMSEIEEILSRDAYLTYALLKLANSRYFTSFKKISSVRQGLMILGVSQLRQWIYILSLHGNEREEARAANEEILRVSFLRGTFCSKLSEYVKEFPFTRNEAYIMGMFSTLNYMVEAPMEEILKEIPIEPALKAALINQEGICGQLYALVLDYERAGWRSIAKRIKILGIPSNMVAQFYLDCVEEVNSIWENITQSAFEEQEEKDKQAKEAGKEGEPS